MFPFIPLTNMLVVQMMTVWSDNREELSQEGQGSQTAVRRANFLQLLNVVQAQTTE